MADFTFTLTRYPVSMSTPLAATTFAYASDLAFSMTRTRPGLPAGQFATYEFQYQAVPVNGSAPTTNFGVVKWQLVWTSATVWVMNVWNGSAWVPASGFGSLVPTAGWQFEIGYNVRSIASQMFQALGLDTLKNDLPTTYKLVEIVTKNGAAYENNTSTHLFDVRLLATANVVQSTPIFNPINFNANTTISGNWVALPAPLSPYPSTIAGQSTWQPTSANIVTTLPIQFWSYSGGLASNTSTNVPVTATTPSGVVGTFSLPWNGILALLPVLSCFVYQVLGDTGAGNTVPGGASANNNSWPYLSAAVCTRCKTKGGASGTSVVLTPVKNPYGMDLSPSLVYDSTYASQSPTSFGYGWKSIQNVRVSIDGSGNLLYEDETGNFQRWNFTGPSTYTPFTKDNYILASHDTVGHKYTLTFKDQTQRVFNDTTVALPGKLLQTIDRNGNTLTYSYNVAGHITQVVDSTPSARALFYTYGTRTDGQPVSVRANNSVTGRQTQFLYYPPTDPSAPDRLAQIIDPAGETTSFSYYPFGPIAAITDATGKISRQFLYDDIGRKTAEQVYDDLFITYDYGYDAFTGTFTNAMTTTTQDLTGTSPMKIVVTYFDTNFNTTIIKELVDVAAFPAVVNTTNITYNDLVSLNPYLPTQVLAPNLTTTSTTYNPRGNTATTTDALGSVTTYTYAEDIGDPNPKHQNLLVQLNRPTVTVNGVPTNYTADLWTYDANGNLQTHTDALGHNTTYVNNADGTVASVTDVNGHLTAYGYNASTKKLTTITLPKHPYDPAGPSQRITTLGYDTYDNLTSVTDALTHATSMIFDANNRVTQVTDALGKFTTYTYGTVGDPTVTGLLTLIDSPSNQGSGVTRRKTRLSYDGSNRVQVLDQELFAGGFQTRLLYGYTGYSELSSFLRLQANGRLNVSSYSYDTQGRKTVSMDPLGRVSRTKYAAYCNGYELDSARGVRTVVTLDSLCRMTQAASQTELRSYGYDQLSRLVSDANAGRYGWNQDPATVVGAHEGESVYSNGRNYLYDPLDRLTTETFVDTNGVLPTNQYVYDYVGNVLQMTDPNGTVTTNTYYDDNRLATVTLGGGTFTYVYDLAGRILSITFPPSSGIVANYLWDNKNRLLSLQYLKSGANLQSFVYTYDDSNNRITMVDTTGVAAPINWSYTYDWLNRLLSATRNAVTTSYSYDTSDNRLTTTTGATVYNDSYDAGDQLVTRELGATLFESFSYDPDGNTATRTLAAGGAVTSYKWNDSNSLIGFALNGVFQESDFYDASGIRRIRNDGTKFYNSGSLVTSETRPTGAVSYIRGHALLGLKQGTNLFFMISDGLGSMRQMVTTAGVSSATFESDAYGVQTTATGSADLLANTYTGALGVRNETVSGGRQLYYARARWFDSQLGRFLSADPIGYAGSLNLFGYANANPINSVDPMGLDPNAERPPQWYDKLNKAKKLSDEFTEALRKELPKHEVIGEKHLTPEMRPDTHANDGATHHITEQKVSANARYIKSGTPQVLGYGKELVNQVKLPEGVHGPNPAVYVRVVVMDPECPNVAQQARYVANLIRSEVGFIRLLAPSVNAFSLVPDAMRTYKYGFEYWNPAPNLYRLPSFIEGMLEGAFPNYGQRGGLES